ncbi:hypothetical protein [Halocola ammonii]
MDSIKVDILNPTAKKLLKALAELKLIRIRPEKYDSTEFSAFLEQIRSKSQEPLSLDEITKEVEDVRKKRNE